MWDQQFNHFKYEHDAHYQHKQQFAFNLNP